IPVIVVAALVLVGLVVIGIMAAQQNKGPAAVNNTPVPSGGIQTSPAPTSQPGPSGSSGSPIKPPAATATELPASASEEDKIKAVIVHSNEQQIRAWQELDPSVLTE